VAKAPELTGQQAEDVKGGRKIIDCEGYAYLQSASAPKLT